MVDRTTDEAVQLYEALLKEVRHMVENGWSVVPDQRFRIVYFGLAHTCGHPEIARILRDAGAEIVASVISHRDRPLTWDIKKRHMAYGAGARQSAHSFDGSAHHTPGNCNSNR